MYVLCVKFVQFIIVEPKESWTQTQTQIIVRWNVEYEKDNMPETEKWGFF